MTEEPKHWPTERMITEGHTDYATPGDLEPLEDSLLVDIAKICEAPEMAPEECIPCTAYAMVLDRQQARLEALNPPEYVSGFEPEPTPLLDALEDASQDEALARAEYEIYKDQPVAVRFAEQVGVLRDLVEEMLEGPPIPPPGVTLEDLSLLVVASQRWIAMTEAQGVDLSPGQQQVLDATKTVVSRLHHG